MDLLSLRTVTVGYHHRAILPPVDLTIEPGTYLGVVGPNGSGKTTLVRTLLGLLPPVAGRILHPEGRPRVGYVPQRDSLDLGFPLTALEIVRMGRYGRIRRGMRASSADDEASRRALREV